MPNYAFAKVDSNHAALREALRKLGYHWQDTYRQGQGCPDAYVLSKSGRWVAFEVKSPGGELTEAERTAAARLPLGAPYYVVTSVDEALLAMAEYDA